MSGAFSKSMARNVFFGGTVFFFLLFLALTFDTIKQLPKRDMRQNITPQVAEGKHVWETRNCIGCHTLMGEGAYFAPELGNVMVRFGSKEAIKAFIQSRPVEGIEGHIEPCEAHPVKGGHAGAVQFTSQSAHVAPLFASY